MIEQKNKQPEESKPPIINYLFRMVQSENRGGLAELRRGAGKGPNYPPQTLKHVYPFLGKDISSIYERALLITATLFGLYPETRDPNCNMGDVFFKIMQQSGSDSVEKRFIALLDADPDEIENHLRHAVSLARSKEIPIGWSRLLKDLTFRLSRYENQRNRVNREWARGFWKAKGPTPQNAPKNNPSEEEK